MTPPITPLGSRYGIQGALGRSVKRASTASTWWDLNGTITSCVLAYQAKGAASYAASKVNLANPGTYDLVVGNVGLDPIWDSAAGWTGGGTFGNSRYLKTGYATNTINAQSLIVRFAGRNSATIFGSAFGHYGSDTEFGGAIIFTTDTSVGQFGRATGRYIADTADSGVYAVTKIYGNWGTGMSYYFRNGSLDATFNNGAAFAITPYVFAALYSTNMHILACAYYDSTLNAQNVADLTAAMNAL